MRRRSTYELATRDLVRGQRVLRNHGAGRGSRTPTRGEPRRILSPLRLPVPPSRHFVEVHDSKAVHLLIHISAQGNKCETVQQAWKFSMISTASCPCPQRALPAILGLRAHCPSNNRAPVRDSTTHYVLAHREMEKRRSPLSVVVTSCIGRQFSGRATLELAACRQLLLQNDLFRKHQ